MKIHNNTKLTLMEIFNLKVIGKCKTFWRNRDITLFQHPTEQDHVISVGTTFDKSMQVIAQETKQEWREVLENGVKEFH